ncbi:MAG TPA: hypothetical protein VMR86_19055 [Myxococcota bacterium]|nr:hypothetical protein [Myxococcota bacterium]
MKPHAALYLLLVAALALTGDLGAQEPSAPPATARLRYDFHVEAQIVPTERAAHVTLELGKGAENVDWLRFRIDPQRHLLFRGDGQVHVEGAHVTWTPPRTGGKLTYVFRIDHLRDARRYDARCAKTWAIFRGEDLVPPARVKAADGARSHTRFRVRVPDSWSIVTPFGKLRSGEFKVEKRHHAFARPTGWMIAGDLGVLREEVAGVKVAIAGPRTMGVRRQDMLALLHWTLPVLRQVLGTLPERLLVVSAADPMWHGGLSGPDSLFLHAHRPLITEDGPSPLLHEVMHTALGLRPGNDGDWAIEGLAQYYSLQLLGRSHTISPERLAKAFELQAEKGKEAAHLRSRSVSGAGTARSLTVLRALDQRIAEHTHGQKTLDDVVRILVGEGGTVTTDRVEKAAEKVSGLDLSAFFKSEVP